MLIFVHIYEILWLQQDFNIYVCNMFDTGQASRVLKICTSMGSLQTKNIKQQMCQVCIFKTNEAYSKITLIDKVDIVDRVFNKRFNITSNFVKKREHLDVLPEVILVCKRHWMVLTSNTDGPDNVWVNCNLRSQSALLLILTPNISVFFLFVIFHVAAVIVVGNFTQLLFYVSIGVAQPYPSTFTNRNN
uniref:Protein RRP6-like 2 n=1 Tax=Tanacetum cinerariifolium TaxID=118510 RepID=A0A699GZZ5_TANCI|nr:protein RRP6-like 2 [Tanacetum cinerariifolium]